MYGQCGHTERGKGERERGSGRRATLRARASAGWLLLYLYHAVAAAVAASARLVFVRTGSQPASQLGARKYSSQTRELPELELLAIEVEKRKCC